MDGSSSQLSPVLSELDELIDHLDGVRARAAAAFAAETYFFANVADLVQRRERERAERADNGARVDASQLCMREIYADVAAALHISEYQVAHRVSAATVLVSGFPETLYRVSDGVLSPAHAQTIADIGGVIADEGVRAEYEQHALDMAAELTPSQLKAALGGLVSRLDPEGTHERIREAVARRRVTLRELEPGLSRVVADLPTLQAVGIVNRVTDIATELERMNSADASAAEADAPDKADAAAQSACIDTRTRAQIMADIFCDLLLTGAPEGHGVTDEARSALASIRATVQVTIPATFLAGVADGGGEVIGHGPFDDETAKIIAALAANWVRVFTDPVTGVPVTVDSYPPCIAQRRLLEVRDEYCRFPGCRRPARKSDIDHSIAYAEGGPTALWNLAHLCERHHTVKHQTDWHLEQLPGGVLKWTAPTRRIHLTRPPAAVRFVPEREPEPAPF